MAKYPSSTDVGMELTGGRTSKDAPELEITYYQHCQSQYACGTPNEKEGLREVARLFPLVAW